MITVKIAIRRKRLLNTPYKSMVLRTPWFGCYGITIDVIVKSSCVTLTDFHVLDNKCHALNISNSVRKSQISAIDLAHRRRTIQSLFFYHFSFSFFFIHLPNRWFTSCWMADLTNASMNRSCGGLLSTSFSGYLFFPVPPGANEIDIKVGFYLKAVFPSRNLGLMRISRSRFKQSKNCSFISRIYVLWSFVNFWGYLGGDSF